MYESLHNHTTTSDGVEDYLQLLKTAEKHGVGTVAFTDHDALPTESALSELKAYTGPLTWTIGIEISSGAPAELPEVGGLHIIGQFVDVHDAALREHCKKAQVARQERMARIVTNLTKLGFNISEADCLRASGGESVGRPHIVSALFSHNENVERLNELVLEMAADDKAGGEYRVMQERASKRGDQEYAYSLLLGNDAYFKDVYVDYLYKLDMDESVALIRAAGGVALLAHWWCYAQKLPLKILRSYLTTGRLDGIETLGGAGLESSKAYPTLTALAKETNCLTSVGADAHKPADFERYVLMNEIKKTKGVFEKLYDQVQPERVCTNHQD